MQKKEKDHKPKFDLENKPGMVEINTGHSNLHLHAYDTGLGVVLVFDDGLDNLTSSFCPNTRIWECYKDGNLVTRAVSGDRPSEHTPRDGGDGWYIMDIGKSGQ